MRVNHSALGGRGDIESKNAAESASGFSKDRSESCDSSKYKSLCSAHHYHLETRYHLRSNQWSYCLPKLVRKTEAVQIICYDSLQSETPNELQTVIANSHKFHAYLVFLVEKPTVGSLLSGECQRI